MAGVAGAGGDVDVGGLGVGCACGRADGGIDRVSREGGADQRDQQQGCENLQAGPFVVRLRSDALNRTRRVDVFYGDCRVALRTKSGLCAVARRIK